MLTDAIIKNDYKIDAVFAHNDIFAGAAAEVVKELGIKNPVIITGMDAETPALKRLLEGTQDAAQETARGNAGRHRVHGP